MPMKIATWNLCLGLFHKKDYVRNLLHENEIDILTLQETELTSDIDTINLQIKGYTLEVETNHDKRRIAIYIRNTISYKRRSDLEKKNWEVPQQPESLQSTGRSNLRMRPPPEIISEDN
jgi:exonuclease III